MKIIKVSGLHKSILHQTPKNLGIWNNCKFVLDDPSLEECDSWFIFDPNCLKDDNRCVCSTDRIYYVMGEPDSIRVYNDRFVKQFKNIISIQKKQYDVPNIYHDYWGMYFVGLSFGSGIQKINHEYDYDALLKMSVPKKEKLISVVSSNKRYCDGHIQRLEFVEKLKEFFGDKIDVYGRGINSFDDKADVLIPYKYHIAIENSVQDDYITEKLLDPYITYTYPIYHGAENVYKYFNSESYTRIDIRETERSLKIIDDVIHRQKYENNLPFIKESRIKVLNKYNIFSKMASMADRPSKNKNRKLVKLKPESSYFYLYRIKQKILSLIK